MKKFLAALLVMVTPILLLAQTTDVINYQAIIRDSDGDIVKNTSITIHVSIISGSADGAIVYEETHEATTNDNGFLYIHIGDGETTDNYGAIDWGSSRHFLKTEYDFKDGSAFLLAGLSELTSVAYANYANNYDETDPLFNSSVAKGIIGADTIRWNNKIDSEIDGSVTNEIQTLSISNDSISISNGNRIKLPNSENTVWELNNENAYFSNRLYVGDSINVGENGRVYLVQNGDSISGYPINTYNTNPTGQMGMVNWIYNSSTGLSEGWTKFTTNNYGTIGTLFGLPKNKATEIYADKGAGEILIGTGSTSLGGIGFGTNGRLRMYIENGGNIGIGTRNPTEALSVNGTIESMSGGIKFPDGTVQTTASTSVSSISESAGEIIIDSKDLFIPNNSYTLLDIQRFTANSTDSLIFNYNNSDWYYIAWTKASDFNGTIYINGDSIFSSTFNNQTYSHNQVHIAARFFTSFSSFLDGIVDEVRISNKVRTSQEINAYFNSSNPFSVDANTVALWHFDEGVGTTFANETGGNGTLFGNPTWDVGRFGSAVRYDGIDDRGQTDFNPPESDVTYEVWVKFPNGINAISTILQAYSFNNYDLMVKPFNDDKGIIMQSPDGTCWRMNVDNTGQVQTTSITCPN